jgi:hypothetical protein
VEDVHRVDCDRELRARPNCRGKAAHLGAWRAVAAGSIATDLQPVVLPPIQTKRLPMQPTLPATLHFWPGTTVVTFMVQVGEEISVRVVSPQRFLEGLSEACHLARMAQLAQPG